MMKKILCLLLVALMLFSLVACGNNNNSNNTPNNSTPTTETTETTDAPNDETTDLRDGKTLPSDKSEWTDKEKEYYLEDLYDKIVNAVINLDVDFLKDHISESQLSTFKNIQKDEEYAQMYKNTYGKMIYLPESERMLMISTRYTYATWYTNFYLTNSVMPKNLKDFSREDVNAVYENIYKNAPYEAIQFERTWSACEISEGKVVYNIDSMFNDIDAFNLYQIEPSAYENPYAQLIFGDEYEVAPNFNIMGEHKELYKAVYDFDLNVLTAYLEKHSGTDGTATGTFVFEKCRDKSLYDKMEEWFKNNCHVIVSNGSMHIYYIVDNFDIAKNHHPFNTIVENEINLFKDLDIKYGEWTLVSNEDSFLYTMRDMLDMMETDGVFN